MLASVGELGSRMGPLVGPFLCQGQMCYSAHTNP